MTFKITFELKPCSRCGGSGHYSYNQVDGTMCYGCRGSGKQLTKAGKKARIAYDAKRKELCSVPVTSLQIGDKFLASDNHYRTVTEIPAHKGAKHKSLNSDQWIDDLDVETQKMTYVMGSDATVIKKPNAEQFAELVAFARALKGCIVEESEVPDEEVKL